jgi:hypothetical protein
MKTTRRGFLEILAAALGAGALRTSFEAPTPTPAGACIGDIAIPVLNGHSCYWEGSWAGIDVMVDPYTLGR